MRGVLTETFSTVRLRIVKMLHNRFAFGGTLPVEFYHVTKHNDLNSDRGELNNSRLFVFRADNQNQIIKPKDGRKKRWPSGEYQRREAQGSETQQLFVVEVTHDFFVSIASATRRIQKLFSSSIVFTNNQHLTASRGPWVLDGTPIYTE